MPAAGWLSGTEHTSRLSLDRNRTNISLQITEQLCAQSDHAIRMQNAVWFDDAGFNKNPEDYKGR